MKDQLNLCLEFFEMLKDEKINLNPALYEKIQIKFENLFLNRIENFKKLEKENEKLYKEVLEDSDKIDELLDEIENLEKTIDDLEKTVEYYKGVCDYRLRHDYIDYIT